MKKRIFILASMLALMCCLFAIGASAATTNEFGSVEKIDGIDVISEAKLVLTCRKLYMDELKKSNFLDGSLLKNYENGGYHTVFVCEITGAYKKGE